MSDPTPSAAPTDTATALSLQACTRFVKYAEENSPMVRLLVQSIRDKGCTVPPTGFYECEAMDRPVLGAFDPANKKVILNALYIKDQATASRTMVHESIHAFDHCRVALDYNSCQHLACTEVRAANLSTDCNFGRELARGIFKIQGQQKKCVKRRAALSISMQPACAGLDAEKVVDTVFDACYKDTEPFGGIPT